MIGDFSWPAARWIAEERRVARPRVREPCGLTLPVLTATAEGRGRLTKARTQWFATASEFASVRDAERAKPRRGPGTLSTVAACFPVD
jgi:hypothetical protein